MPEAGDEQVDVPVVVVVGRRAAEGETAARDARLLGHVLELEVPLPAVERVAEAVDQMVQVRARFEPAAANAHVYDTTFRTYVDLYTALCPLFSNGKEQQSP